MEKDQLSKSSSVGEDEGAASTVRCSSPVILWRPSAKFRIASNLPVALQSSSSGRAREIKKNEDTRDIRLNWAIDSSHDRELKEAFGARAYKEWLIKNGARVPHFLASVPSTV
mmetsp:Transcript_25793/g.43174  ORF Transcript_25793/g.43174 Transcript_25793/m.43174 type:complete len:113 (-) Transcript_25793:489-827(-)